MGDRNYIDITCPECGKKEENWYYAPTSHLGLNWHCRCGYTVNLEEYTGISYEDASNLQEIKEIIRDARVK